LCAALFPQPARAAGAKPSDQTLIVRLSALDDLVADFLYLAEVAGKKDEAEQLEQYVKSLAEDGIKGLDTKKPIGLYAKLKEAADRSAVVVLLPIKDEKAFLDFLDRVNVKAKKSGDVYEASAAGLPVAVYFRFADGYVYFTAIDSAHIAKDNLLSPAEVLAAGDIGTMSATFNLDQIPDTYKKLALTQIDDGLAKARKETPPGETATQKEFRIAAVNEVGAYLRSAINDGAASMLRLDVDRKKGDLGLTFTLAGKPKSKLAEGVEGLGAGKSVAAGLSGADSAFSSTVNLSLPENLRKLLEPVVDEGFAKALEDVGDKTHKELAEKVVKALAPSLKAAALDAGLTLEGSSAGKYVAVFGLRVADGSAIEKVVKDLHKELPAGERDKVKLDFDKAGSVAIHRVEVDRKELDAGAREAFGDSPYLYVAFRGDALLASFGGDKALAALKDAVGRDPKAGRAMQVELSLSRLAPLMAREQKGAVEAARKAFGDKKDSDKVLFTIEGGKALKVRWASRAQVVKFGVLLDEARKKDL
jgi:hypothetical protein